MVIQVGRLLSEHPWQAGRLCTSCHFCHHSLPPPLVPPWRSYQAEQALPIDRVSKGLSLAMWGAGVCKCLSRGYRREAALAAAVAAAALLLLCASVWSRGAYVRRARWLTACMLVLSHAVAAAVSASGYRLMPVSGLGCFTKRQVQRDGAGPAAAGRKGLH